MLLVLSFATSPKFPTAPWRPCLIMSLQLLPLACTSAAVQAHSSLPLMAQSWSGPRVSGMEMRGVVPKKVACHARIHPNRGELVVEVAAHAVYTRSSVARAVRERGKDEGCTAFPRRQCDLLAVVALRVLADQNAEVAADEERAIHRGSRRQRQAEDHGENGRRHSCRNVEREMMRVYKE